MVLTKMMMIEEGVSMKILGKVLNVAMASGLVVIGSVIIKYGKGVRLSEISGIDQSLVKEDRFFVHNDSGDKAKIFGVDVGGELKVEVKMKGVKARDFEDISTAPCRLGTCIYVADIGDNDLKRDYYSIYEMKDEGWEDGDYEDKDVVEYRFNYSDGTQHNAEAFSYNPSDEEFYIVTKDEPSYLYKLPTKLYDGMLAMKVCKMDLSKSSSNRPTGMDIGKDGGMVVRTYSHILYFKEIGCEPSAAYKFKEKQGEAIAFVESGDKDKGRVRVITTSEESKPKLNIIELKK